MLPTLLFTAGYPLRAIRGLARHTLRRRPETVAMEGRISSAQRGTESSESPARLAGEHRIP
jgi:hypothetical protein